MNRIKSVVGRALLGPSSAPASPLAVRAGRVVSALGRPLARRAWRDTALVVAFHSIRDGLRSPMVCSEARFCSFLDVLEEAFVVASISELERRLRAGEPVGGLAVITFDDGYLDNATFAGPELVRRRLPASFYVASAYLGSTSVPYWDDYYGVDPHWMEWDHVRYLRDQGFEIGGHTAHHVDLGVADPDTVRAEVRACADDIERELGLRPVHFAYPFGKPETITDLAREIISEEGFRTCMSCHGGVVRRHDDPMLIRRVSVAPWFETPEQLYAELTRVAMQRRLT